MSKFKRFIAAVLVAAVLVVGLDPPRAEAVLVVDDIVIAAVLGVAATCGLVWSINDKSADSAKAYIGSKITDYCSAVGIAESAFLSTVAGNVGFKSSGQIFLREAAASAVKSFLNWMNDTDEIPASVDDAGIQVQGVTCFNAGSGFTVKDYLTAGSIEISMTSYSAPVYYFFYCTPTSNGKISYHYPIFFSSAPFSFHAVLRKTSYDFSSKADNMFISFTSFISADFVDSLYPWFNTDLSRDQVVNLIRGDAGLLETPADTLAGTFDSTGVDTLTDTDALAIDTGIAVPSGLTADEIAAAILGGIVAIPTIDIPTAITDEVVPADVIDTDPDVTVPDTVPVVVPDTALGSYAYDLTDFFPFCLPFDMYNMLNKLDAAPVTPAVKYDFYVLKQHFYIDLSLEDFDGVAAILRNMELLAFCLGLAFVTRGLIRG